MRVWIYARLSNDEDQEMNSLLNQQAICRDFCITQGYQIVGTSADNNVSGMTLSRPGLDKLIAAADSGKIDGIVVKDLSRLGRHRTQTELLIDYLRERQIRVLSVTEGIDTLCDEDDLIIGVRGLMNDYYVRDLGNKIRAGYQQKLQDGLVITPPFGYWKDRNVNQIKVHPEAAETVKIIYDLYLQGYGQKQIARRLNELQRKTPSQLRAERCGQESFATYKTRSGDYLWTYVSVKNILTTEDYTGVSINRKSVINCGKVTRLPKEQWYRHEGFYPVIIERERWLQAQSLLREKARPAVCNKTQHRYAGLLACRECGNPFAPMNRYWRGNRRVEYVCKGYQRNGKSYCASHRIHEETLDAMTWEWLIQTQKQRKEELEKILNLQKMWALRKPILDAHILSLQMKVQRLESEIDDILMEKLRSFISMTDT